MISANGGLPAHRYIPQVTPRWPRGSEPASVCVFVCAPRSKPRASWPGCEVWACVLGLGFRLCPATTGWGVGVCVCVRAYALPLPRHSGQGGASVCGFGFRLPSGLFLAWGLGGVASFVRRVRFWSPSGGAACGVGVCGSCCGWGLSPPPPLLFFFLLQAAGGGGRCRFPPCRVVALLCLSLAVLLLGLVVSVPPSPLVQVTPSWFFLFFFCPSMPQQGVCWRLWGVFPSAGLLLLVECRRFWLGRPPVFLSEAPWVPFSVLFGWGVCPPLLVWVGSLVAVGLSRALPPFFWGRRSACSSVCLPWAVARTGRHWVWLTWLLLVLAFCWALPRPHRSGGFCTRLARWPF